MRLSHITVLGALVAIAAPCLRAELANGIKAIVHDSVITYADVEFQTEQTAEVLRRQYRGQPEQFQKKMEETRADNLEKLLERELILHDFKTAGYNLPEKVIDDIVEERIRSKYRNRVTFIKSLHEEGLTSERFRQQVRDQFIVEALRQKNISSEIIVSPHKVETYYAAHKDEFKVEDEVKLRILVPGKPSDPTASNPQKLAEEILTKLKEGATFSEMSAIYSQETRGNQEGKWYEKTQLKQGLADVAFALQPGQYSGVLSRSAGEDYWICQYEGGQRTRARHYGVDPNTKKESLVEEVRFENAGSSGTNEVSGTNVPPPAEFFIMLVEEKRETHFKPLNDVRDEIEKRFRLEERNRLEKQWIERLKRKTFVRYF